MSSIVIVDNHSELEIIESRYPDLKTAPLILLSGNFSLAQIEEYKEREYTYFDDLISDNDASKLSDNIHNLLWSWFLDENGNDLSLIDGCSLGVAFCGSLEMLFATMYRYLCGLEKLLKRSHEVIFCNSSEDIFLDVIVSLQEKIGFSVRSVETNKTKDIVTYGKHKLILDEGGRKRDLSPAFLRNGGWKDWLATRLLGVLQTKPKAEKRVMLMSAGKMESYLEYVLNTNTSTGFRWLVRLSNPIHLMDKRTASPLFYYFSSRGPKHTLSMDALIDRLKINIRHRINLIDIELLIKVLMRHTFVYFQGAINYFHNAEKALQSLAPKLVVISAEVEECFLVSQAAKKSNIKTALLPHGIDVWGFQEVKSGRFKIVDYFLAHGNEDVEFFKRQNVSINSIIKTSHPWFEKFLPIQLKQQKQYKQALVLAYELYPMSAYEKVSEFNQYIMSVVEALDEIDINVKIFKVRGDYIFKSHGGESGSVLKVGKHSVKVVQGYGNLVDYLDQVDLVVGPISTALIESGLCGKDYYAYQNHKHLELVSGCQPSIYKYLNVAFSMKQLQENILKKQPYIPGHSVVDLVDLYGVSTKEALFYKFESGIQAVLNSIEMKELVSEPIGG